MSQAHYAATKSYSRPTETFTGLVGAANYSTPTAPRGFYRLMSIYITSMRH